MIAVVQFDSEEVGKRVVDANGREVGVVKDVQADRAYVDPDPSVVDELASQLGVGSADEDTVALSSDDVRAVTDEELQLREGTAI